MPGAQCDSQRRLPIGKSSGNLTHFIKKKSFSQKLHKTRAVKDDTGPGRERERAAVANVKTPEMVLMPRGLCAVSSQQRGAIASPATSDGNSSDTSPVLTEQLGTHMTCLTLEAVGGDR